MATQDGSMHLDPGETAVYAVAVVLLVLGAGLMSGLTLGLLSLDVMDLEVSMSHSVHAFVQFCRSVGAKSHD